MALAQGTKLGPYEVQSTVGAGGMGEVYRARDTRLDRTVAIKVLPVHLSADPDMRARFEREAKAISGMQHPNICVLYDVGSQDNVDFLVMEYLEGETLFTRLARKALTSDEALKIAIEVADALEKAHRGGVVHRDLKPGNVMLTKAGAKLMDFGLAKPHGLSAGPSSGAPSFSSMATLADMASPITVAGTLVGTVQYMSPEQIQGKEADARSDIFSFGAMLYEMFTQKRAFEGKSQLSVASAILEREPEPIATVQPLTPPAIEQVVRTCLAKDPDDRFQSAHDLKLQLQWIAASGSKAGIPAIVSSQRKSRGKLLMVAMSAGWMIAAAAVLALLWYDGRLSSASQMVRASIESPAGFNARDVIEGAPSLSPDGKLLAFVALKQGASSTDPSVDTIFVRGLGEAEAHPVAGTNGGSFPFWSPDSRYIGFFSDGKLRKVEAGGGPAQVLCDAPKGRGGSWSLRGTIVFAPGIEGPLASVPDGGGTPTALPGALKGESGFTNRNPLFLPDGKHFLFTARGGREAVANVFAGSLDGEEPRQVLAAGSNVDFADGYLFFIKEGTLTAQKFDPAALKFEGNPITIASDIEYYNPRDLAYFSVERNLLVYRVAIPQNRELAWLDVSGKELEHWGDPAPFDDGRHSWSSNLAVLSRANSNGRGNSLWVADLQRKTLTRITLDSDLRQSAVIAPDGNSAFISTTSGYVGTLERHWLTASGKDEKILDSSRAYFDVVSISHDGRYVFFNQQDPKTSFDVYYMDLQGDRSVKPLLTSTYAEYDARLSPDNKWLAYSSSETGRTELYVTRFPELGAKWQVSNGGVTVRDTANVMEWSREGKNLRYQQGDKIYDVALRMAGDKPEFSPPRELATLPPNVVVISILPDDKRILVTRPVGDAAPVPLDLVLNWKNLVH